MKNILLAALLAFSASAFAAGDYKAFITVEGTNENIHGTSNDINGFNLIPGVKFTNGVTVDLKTQLQRTENVKTNDEGIEARVRYDYALGATGLTAWGRLGIGERVVTGDTFGYYTVEPGVTYEINKQSTVFVSDRYRDAFANGKVFKTNTVYVGTGYSVTDVDVVSAKLYRKYEDVTSNGVELSYTRLF
jgi:hypothetical protein